MCFVGPGSLFTPLLMLHSPDSGQRASLFRRPCLPATAPAVEWQDVVARARCATVDDVLLPGPLQVTSLNLGGYLIAFAGVCWYNYKKLGAMRAKQVRARLRAPGAASCTARGTLYADITMATTSDKLTLCPPGRVRRGAEGGPGGRRARQRRRRQAGGEGPADGREEGVNHAGCASQR